VSTNIPLMVAQFVALPGLHTVTEVKRPSVRPTGPPPAVIATVLFAPAGVIALLPAVDVLLLPQPATQIKEQIKTKNGNLDTLLSLLI
jgi:hypothetical protein